MKAKPLPHREVPNRFMWALKVLAKKAETPMVPWTGDVAKVRQEAERIRLEKVVKIRKMLEDLDTVGWEKACEIHGINEKVNIDNIE